MHTVLSRFHDLLFSTGLLDGDTLEDELAVLQKEKFGSRKAILALQADENGWTALDYALADRLVEYDLLSAWQVSQLLSGKGRFTLGPYRIVDSIGQGGYGMVFLAKHEQFERGIPLEGEKRPLFAVKVLPISKANPELTGRFLQEIDIQKDLTQENIVRFLDSGHDARVHYMVHEFIDGDNLAKCIRKQRRLPLHEVAKIIGDVAIALHYLHSRKIVHRDVKPSNILRDHTGKAKLADFGLAVHLKLKPGSTEEILVSESLQQIQEQEEGEEEEWEVEYPRANSGQGLQKKVAGTADYLAPDQIHDPHHPNGLWDIYSLGCTFYHAITGIVPFPGGSAKQKILAHLHQDPPDPRDFSPDLPSDPVLLLREMMCRDPQKRISSALEIVRRLQPWTNPPISLQILSRTQESLHGIGSFQDADSTHEPEDKRRKEFTYIRFPSTGDVLRVEVPPRIPQKNDPGEQQKNSKGEKTLYGSSRNAPLFRDILKSPLLIAILSLFFFLILISVLLFFKLS